ncbi:DUF2771 family protein [Gordonia soli]|uniref:DUF2771 domain-containing protein n=1 Tax=Gordonia soli NBRC 108243 TaxID=1223545 RepID=M0QI83_9ACTN|nr:DUF2771 family protein [Gordonia soli]GAC68325.1 hypothetical protein GS4_14_01580 [Gordonia soli NBRC 108243]
MNLSSGEKKALAIGTAVLVAFVAVVATSVALLSRGGDHDERPYLHLAIGDRLVQVKPAIWCDLFLRSCEPSQQSLVSIPHVPVPVGESVMLSVSQGISESPWRLVAEYLTPRGSVEDIHQMRSNSTVTTVLPSRPDYILVNVEVTVVSAVPTQDQQSYESRGLLAVNTIPEGLKVPDEPAA